MTETRDWKPLGSFAFTGPTAGISHLNLPLPDHLVHGDVVHLRIRVTDPSRVDAFELEALLTIKPPVPRATGTRGRDRNRNSGAGNGDTSSGSALPNVIPVYDSQWGPPRNFDEYSAIDVVFQGESATGQEVYDFYVNYDNRHLLTALKARQGDVEALRAQFVYSLVLYSMGLLMKQPQSDPGEHEVADADGSQTVRRVTRHIAGFVLPILSAMSALSE